MAKNRQVEIKIELKIYFEILDSLVLDLNLSDTAIEPKDLCRYAIAHLRVLSNLITILKTYSNLQLTE